MLAAVATLAKLQARIVTREKPLEGQPFDKLLLAVSPLYRTSRALFLKSGPGQFKPALLTSPRSLSSPSLLLQKIEYSPVETELIWAATDPRERRNPAHLETIRTYTTSLFHEQNHRILWRMLPSLGLKAGRESVRRYLHLAEAFVIALDMALGDELLRRRSRKPESQVQTLYLVGSIYDRGVPSLRSWGKLPGRIYRNYLHVLAYGTYLHLEMHPFTEIREALKSLYAASFGTQYLALYEQAVDRTGRLDPHFVEITNPVWQALHWKKVRTELGGRKIKGQRKSIELPIDPMDHAVFYLKFEKILKLFGL